LRQAKTVERRDKSEVEWILIELGSVGCRVEGLGEFKVEMSKAMEKGREVVGHSGDWK
jgi:hypothetical protein